MKRYKIDINIYNYNDHAVFLREAYEDLHAKNPDISVRYIQRQAGYSGSSNHFWQVMKGRAPLSRRAAERFGRVLGLRSRQIEFLATLAALKQSKNDEERRRYARELDNFSRYREAGFKDHISYRFYSDWRLPAIREIVNLHDFQEDPEWIADRLGPRTTPRQVNSGLKKLLEMGYLKRDDSGKLRQEDPVIGRPDDRQDDALEKLAVRSFHKKMIKLGAEAIESCPQSERFITGATVSISRNQQEALNSLIRDFMKQAIAIVEKEEPPELVCRLNVQSFPITKTK